MNSNLKAVQPREPDAQTKLINLAIDRAEEWLKHPKQSQRDLASGAGVGRSAISRWITRNYADGDNLNVAQKVLAFLDRDARTRQMDVTIEPVSTPAFRTVQAALDIAQYTRKLAIIYGAPGVGKTFAAQAYEQRDPGYILLQWTRYGMGTPKGYMAELLCQLQGDAAARYFYPARMSGMILDSLRQRPRFIIVNDAHRLRFPVFELACDIVEQAKCPMAFIGHDCMKDTLTSLRKHDSEVYDRVVDFSDLTHVQHKWGKKYSNERFTDIKAVATQLLPDATDDACAFLADTDIFDSMRHVVYTCLDAKRLRTLANKKLPANETLIRQALKHRRPDGV